MSYGMSYNSGSFMIDNNGHIKTTSGSEKFKQNIYKFLVTHKVGLYGTDAYKLSGVKLRRDAVDLNLKSHLKQAIYNFTLIQKTNRFLTDDETLTNASLNTWIDQEDQNKIDWQAVFELKSGVIIDDIPSQSVKFGV